MIIRPNNNRVLLFLAALLTLSASGDDINFLRLALPSAFALSPVGSFPIDDENSDFTRPSDSQESQHPLPIRTLPAGRSVETVKSLPTSLSTAPVPLALTNHQLSADSAMTPLRC
jgi:hypothetical protein